MPARAESLEQLASEGKRSRCARFCCSEGDGPVSFKASPAPSPHPPCRGGGRSEDLVLSRNDLQRKSVPGLPVLRPRSPRLRRKVTPSRLRPRYPRPTPWRLRPSQPAQSGPGRRRCPGRQIGIPYAHQVVEGLAHSLQPGSSRTAYVASVAGVGHCDQLRVGHFRVPLQLARLSP